MIYEEIKEKFEEIKNVGVKEAKKTINIKDYEKQISDLKETLIKSNSAQENRDSKINQININLEKEKDKIEEHNRLMNDFFEHHNPNDRHISVYSDVSLKIDNVKKEIAYIDKSHEAHNFIYKIEIL